MLEKQVLILDQLIIVICLKVTKCTVKWYYHVTNVIIGSLEELKDQLMEELDYATMPEPAWNLSVSWYGLSAESRPIVRYNTLLLFINTDCLPLDMLLSMEYVLNT